MAINTNNALMNSHLKILPNGLHVFVGVAKISRDELSYCVGVQLSRVGLILTQNNFEKERESYGVSLSWRRSRRR